MAESNVVVVGTGMVSAVGLSAPEVAASVRSGTAIFNETAIMDKRFEPFVLAEVPEDGLPPLHGDLEGRGLTSREARMLRLAEPALRECLAALPPRAALPPLILALPETETTRPLDDERVLDVLAVQVDGFQRKSAEAMFRGRAGGLRAVARAVDWLNAGAPFVVAGGVDTFRDLYVLGTLDMEGRVKASASLDGFIPGEGAGFLLLASRTGAAAAGLTPLAALSGFALGTESGHLYSDQPYRGDGLSAALATALANGAGPVQEVYSSMNGESHWAKEWGVAFLRARDRFREDHGMHHPADCHGDTGAAAGPLMIALAALGIRDGYRATPTLVYTSSDRGERAAIIVSAA
jgi:3-oxoacyl-[acyl-carrier-protein] synthase I